MKCFLYRTFVVLGSAGLFAYLILYDFGTQNWKIDQITSMQSRKLNFFLKGFTGRSQFTFLGGGWSKIFTSQPFSI